MPNKRSTPQQMRAKHLQAIAKIDRTLATRARTATRKGLTKRSGRPKKRRYSK